MLLQAVASASNQIDDCDEIVVVIDNNPGLLAAATRVMAGPKVLANTNRPGLSGARNTGVAASRGDIVVFLDDDAVPSADWLAGHIKQYAEPRVVGVGGSVIPMWSTERAPAWFPAEFLWVVGCTYSGIRDETYEIRNPLGANMSFRRSALDQAGPFSESLGRIGTKPLGCEETELSVRMTRVVPNSSIVYHPPAQVHHHVPAERATIKYFLSRCRAEGRSKAVVREMEGQNTGLSSERHYVRAILPLGLLQAAIAFCTRAEVAALGRSLAIITGLAVTTGGYVEGRAILRWQTAGPARRDGAKNYGAQTTAPHIVATDVPAKTVASRPTDHH